MISRLAEAYRAASSRAVKASSPAATELGPVLADLCRAGRAAHPELRLGDAAFVAHLARCGAPVADGEDAVQAGDLFLVCAALAGEPAAVRELRRQHRPVVAKYLRPIDVSPPFLEEVEQRLWDELLVGRRDRAPKLAGYTGAGAVAGFVGVSAQRIALGMLRNRAVEARAVAGAGRESEARADEELAFIKRRYREGFQRAIEGALGVLSDRERMIFRMHFVDGLTVDRIARAYGVSQSTMSRWLGEGRRRVLAEARGILRGSLRVTDSEFESIARLLVSQLDINVSRALGGKS